MTRQNIIERTLFAINQLPDDKAQEISNFADFVFKRYEEELLNTHKRNIATKAKNKVMEIYYKTNNKQITYAYIYEHIELEDDLKPYLNLQTPPPIKTYT